MYTAGHRSTTRLGDKPFFSMKRSSSARQPAACSTTTEGRLASIAEPAQPELRGLGDRPLLNLFLLPPAIIFHLATAIKRDRTVITGSPGRVGGISNVLFLQRGETPSDCCRRVARAKKSSVSPTSRPGIYAYAHLNANCQASEGFRRAQRSAHKSARYRLIRPVSPAYRARSGESPPHPAKSPGRQSLLRRHLNAGQSVDCGRSVARKQWASLNSPRPFINSTAYACGRTIGRV